MSDYGEFVDAEMKKREEAQAAAEADRKAKREAEEAKRASIAAPLDSLLIPTLDEAERQLNLRGIKLDRSRGLSQQVIGDFKVFRSFRLEKMREDRGRDFSAQYAFRVYPGGNIEASEVISTPTRGEDLHRIFLKEPSKLTAEDIESVVKMAIANLIANGR